MPSPRLPARCTSYSARRPARTASAIPRVGLAASLARLPEAANAGGIAQPRRFDCQTQVLRSAEDASSRQAASRPSRESSPQLPLNSRRFLGAANQCQECLSLFQRQAGYIEAGRGRSFSECHRRQSWAACKGAVTPGFGAGTGTPPRPTCLAPCGPAPRSKTPSRIARAKAKGTKSGKTIGRPPLKTKKLDAAHTALAEGHSIRAAALAAGISVGAVAALKKEMGSRIWCAVLTAAERANCSRHVVGDTITDMVALANDNVQAQIWIGINDGLPRMIRVTYLKDPAQARYEIQFANSHLNAATKDSDSTSAPALKAPRMRFAPPDSPAPEKQ